MLTTLLTVALLHRIILAMPGTKVLLQDGRK